MKYTVSIIAAGILATTTAALAAEPAAPPEPATVEAPVAGHIPPPPKGKSEVVFFRTGAYAGAMTWFKIRENGAELGKLTNQSYFVAVLDPGPHTFTASTENKTKLKLELDNDEIYYVRGSLQMGILLYEVSLGPADQAMFELHYKHMRQVKSSTDDAPAAPVQKTP